MLEKLEKIEREFRADRDSDRPIPVSLVRRCMDSKEWNTSQLPHDLMAELVGGFANPKERFRETDVSDTSLPLRRLVVAGVSDQYVLVDYEKGGISDFLFSHCSCDQRFT